MFSRDTLITGAIGHKLDENWPILFVNLLFANGFTSVSPIAPVINLSLENMFTFTPREL